jgi:hypothetical protein
LGQSAHRKAANAIRVRPNKIHVSLGMVSQIGNGKELIREWLYSMNWSIVEHVGNHEKGHLAP